MIANPYQVIVTADVPARGADPGQALIQFVPTECVLTWSWGLQPSTALIDWVSASTQAIVPVADMKIELRRRSDAAVLHTFYGLCRSVAPKTGSDGRSTFQEFVDTRDFLQWDMIYGMWNQRESKLVNGHWVRRYWHILPYNANLMLKTYTNAPYQAYQILDFMFNAPTVESPWARFYHPSLLNVVYGVDCLSGKKLGTAILEITERCGLVFTLQGGKYQLIWALKGAGTVPPPPATSDQRRLGTALSGNPTRIRVLGDRNIYQVLNLQLEPDWLAGWQDFYDLDWFADDLYQHERTEGGTPYNAVPGDGQGIIGRQLASARARTITVGQYANLRDFRDASGWQFRDTRKYGGRSRLQMPAALYIANILFRAFRPPAGFALRNADGNWVNVFSLELLDRAVVEVFHDPLTGNMSYETDVISAGNGYAIAQGYQVGLDGFKTLRPRQFRASDWLGGQATWQHLSFTTDDSGEGTKFILFDAPVISSSELIQDIVIGGVTQSYAGLKSRARVVAPPVRAALTFAAERFSYVAGAGTRDDVENVPGLFAELVAFANGALPLQMPYADGLTASQKAANLAAVLLNRQFYYQLGGWVDPVVSGIQLSAVIDRVTLRYNANGTSEEVDLTNERSRAVVATVGGGYAAQVEPERDFDRRAQLLHLLPGQRELIEEARQQELVALAFQANPQAMQQVLAAFHAMMGLDAPPAVVVTDPAFDPGSLPALPLGTPMWRAGNEAALAHGDAVDALGNEVFLGVTVFDQESAAGPIRVTAAGDQGVVVARVQGPINAGDVVGLGDTVQTYLVGSPTQASVGTALEAVGGAVVALARVRVSGGGGGDLPVWL